MPTVSHGQGGLTACFSTRGSRVQIPSAPLNTLARAVVGRFECLLLPRSRHPSFHGCITGLRTTLSTSHFPTFSSPPPASCHVTDRWTRPGGSTGATIRPSDRHSPASAQQGRHACERRFVTRSSSTLRLGDWSGNHSAVWQQPDLFTIEVRAPSGSLR